MEKARPGKFKGIVKKKILIVDDILYIVKSISKILQDEGYFVITAMSGGEALVKFEKYSPNLITIDQNLPDMTGFQLVEKIRKLKERDSTKIIFISALYEKEIIKSILSHGVDNYLIKPFEKNNLIKTVKELIGGKKKL
ncbi:MAG: response regulator [Spirochaetes bacterium]|nr:response regulator [Spirochaetota bacterium]